MKKIVINPFTRISGFMELQVIVEQKMVVDAWTSGLLFRGFETMLQGRPPLDAIYFTERICGICSTAHAMASTLALEEALNVQPTENDRMIRDFIHGCEFLQNHVRHFYQYTLPDYIRGPELQPLYPVEHADFHLPEKINQTLICHYLQSTEYSRMAHEMLAVLGGKAPHNHGIFVGGVTVNMDAAKWVKVRSLLSSIKDFAGIMLEDIQQLGRYYPEYFTLGGGYGNLMSYGVFDKYPDPELSYVKAGILLGNNLRPMNPERITENIAYAWYQADQVTMQPEIDKTTPDLAKDRAYTWVKAPRYEGYPLEVGPLARMWLSGNYTNGISAMDRTIARGLEVLKVIEIMEALLERIQIVPAEQQAYEMPTKAQSSGLIDTTRGALGHWLAIDNGRIAHYSVITPTAWNLSPRDSWGQRGVIEEALIGTPIADPEHPVEIGRIVRSFDPCVSCATHLYNSAQPPIKVQVL